MTVLSFNINMPGQSGVFPSEIMIETNNTLAEVMTVGYLDHMFAENVPLMNGMMALVSVKPTPNSPVTQSVWLNVTFANGRWSLTAAAAQLKSEIKAATTSNIGGAGAGPLTVSVPGLTAASVVVASVESSTNACSVIACTAGTDSFDITVSADPGATLIVNYIAFITAQ